MKLIKLFLLCLLGAFAVSGVAGQSDVGINMLTQNSGVVNQGGTVFLEVTINSNGPTAGIPAGSVVVSIFVPSIVQIQSSGHILPPGWQDLGDFGTGGSEYYICNGSDAIPAGASRTLLIAIQGITVGGPSTISGNISLVDCDFNPVVLPGDSPNNNGGTASIKVQTAPACSLAVSASAGTIACNGGTTTLTATATGGNGVVEYSLNGGAFQSGNTFTISATGSPYTVTAREVSNPTCTATSNSVTVSNPAVVPAPTVNVAQPTCTVATGTITITSGTTGLTFSLNGGAYATYPSGGYTVNGGAHTLTAQNTSGCLSSVTNITINVQPATPAAPTVSVLQPTCTVAMGAITITSTTAGLNFSLDGGTYASYPSGGYTVNAGAHTLTAQNTSGCISSVTNITVNVQPATPAAPIVSVIQPTCTAATGTITITSSTTGLTFSVDGGAYAAYPAGGYTLSAGSHTLTTQNSSGCISAVTSIAVNAQPSTPAAPIVSVVQPTCTVATGTITVTSTTTGLTFSLDGGAYGSYPTGGYTVASGSHTLTVQNASGCISSITNITVNAQPQTPTAPIVSNIIQPTCAISTGSVVLNGLPSGNWIINPGVITGNIATATINGLAQGTYNFSVTNSVGCISSPSANVIINNVPGAPAAPTINVAQTTCATATGTITVTSTTAGLNFSLDGGVYGAYPAGGYVVAAGSHTLSTQNAAFCISPVTNITVNAQPATPAAPTISLVQPTCAVATGTVTITSSTTGLTFSLDGGVYAAYPAGGYTAATGSHTLTAQNASGCISVVTNITVNAQPATSAAPTIGPVTQPTCVVLTGSVVLNGLPSGSWIVTRNPGSITTSGNTSSVTINGLVPGTYNFTVTNSAGCTSAVSAGVVITVVAGTPAAPTVNVVQPTCTVATGTITITSSTTGLTFSLDGGAYASYPSGGYIVVSGSHTLTAQNAALCTSPVTNITVNTQPATPAAPTVNIVQPTCTAAGGTITITSSTTGLTFSLDGGAYTAYPAGGYTLAAGSHTLTAQNASSCISAVTNITVNAQPATPAASTVNVVQPTCTAATGTIIITSSTTGLTFSLDGGAYEAYPTTGYTAAAGSHTLTAQNASSCISPITNITVNAQPVIPAAPTVNVVQPTCTIATGTITITSSTTGLTFSLDGGAYAAYPAIGYTAAAGSHTLTAQNASGCISAAANVIINIQPPSPAISASAGTIVCFGGTTTLSVTASGGTSPFEYSLNGGAFQLSNTFIAGAGIYTITARNAELCTADATVTVAQPTAITATASASANVISCNGGITTLIVSANGGAGSLQYSLNGGIFQAGNNFTVGAGNYTVTVKDANSCTVITPVVTITQPATLIASAFAKRITQCGGTTVVTVIASGGVTPYTSGVGNFTRGPGTWSFVVIDARGCTDTTDIVIEAPGCVDLKIYPNPTKNSIIVNHSIAEPGSVMQVFSINGALLLTKAVPQNAFQTTIDVSRLAAASYVLVYLNGNDKKEILFVKVSSQ